MVVWLRILAAKSAIHTYFICEYFWSLWNKKQAANILAFFRHKTNGQSQGSVELHDCSLSICVLWNNQVANFFLSVALDSSFIFL